MTTKLTLSIEKKTVERAKILSSKTGKSISKMVEDYLNLIADKGAFNGSAVEKLSGILKNKVPENMDWKEVKANHLKKKYGV